MNANPPTRPPTIATQRAELNPPLTSARAADVALLVIYGGVVAFFMFRWFVHRRPASMGIAMMAAAWILIACWDLGIIAMHPSGWLRWCGAAVGVYLLTSVFRAEFSGPDLKR